ncbi:MAG TPA: GspH/FimT family pseudopilin [Rhodanobacteraceae bacterium]|nr:GspH/FimT family pseudopilin [Rhodanobacteraceae bacterium]
MALASPLSNRRGFTLIELLITLSIAGILAAIGMPALGSMLARSHRQSAESALEASLMHAREMAIMHDTHVIVCPSSDGAACSGGANWQYGWLIAADADHDDQPDRGSFVAVFNAMPSGMRILASRGRPRIVFRSDGSASGTNAQLTVCHTGDPHAGVAVVVSNSGRVRVGDAEPDRLEACLGAAG